MNTAKEQKLQATLATLHKRFGSNAVQKGFALPSKVTYSTGFPALDELIGGIPQGRITELIGLPTSGMTTIALQIIAHAQKHRRGVVYFDLSAALDPEYAAYCGVNLADLMVIRDDLSTCADILYDSILTDIPGLVVFNTVPGLTAADEVTFAHTLQRLQAALPQKHCALVVLTFASPAPSRVSAYITLRLRSQFERWLGSELETYGYQAVVTVLKAKSGIEGRKVAIQITFDDKTEADP